MWNLKRRIFSQNFLHNGRLVKKLIRQSSIGPNDAVLEIGPGQGIITEELLKVAQRIIAVELDTQLYSYLLNKFQYFGYKLQLINKDFLQYKLPLYPYKVFANIPFSIEGKIIRKLLNSANPPQDSYLIMREDLAQRLGGYKKESQFSIFYKPWFTFEIIHYFKRTDFIPHARMDTVMLRFTKKRETLLPTEEKKRYMMFVGQGFGGGKLLKHNLKLLFTHEQFRRLSKQYEFSMQSKPSELTLEQWLALFAFARSIGKI